MNQGFRLRAITRKHARDHDQRQQSDLPPRTPEGGHLLAGCEPVSSTVRCQRLFAGVGVCEPGHVRHATPDDLEPVEALLQKLRDQPQLRERKPGYFSRGSRAFLHFHVEGDDLYVDVRLGAAFERVRVTNAQEQDGLLSRVQRSLR